MELRRGCGAAAGRLWLGRLWGGCGAAVGLRGCGAAAGRLRGGCGAAAAVGLRGGCALDTKTAEFASDFGPGGGTLQPRGGRTKTQKTAEFVQGDFGSSGGTLQPIWGCTKTQKTAEFAQGDFGSSGGHSSRFGGARKPQNHGKINWFINPPQPTHRPACGGDCVQFVVAARGSASQTAVAETSKEDAEGTALNEEQKFRVKARLLGAVLIGDFFHNLCDGFFIGAAFQVCGNAFGWSVEIADFVVLTGPGVSFVAGKGLACQLRERFERRHRSHHRLCNANRRFCHRPHPCIRRRRGVPACRRDRLAKDVRPQAALRRATRCNAGLRRWDSPDWTDSDRPRALLRSCI